MLYVVCCSIQLFTIILLKCLHHTSEAYKMFCMFFSVLQWLVSVIEHVSIVCINTAGWHWIVHCTCTKVKLIEICTNQWLCSYSECAVHVQTLQSQPTLLELNFHGMPSLTEIFLHKIEYCSLEHFCTLVTWCYESSGLKYWCGGD